MMQPSTRRPIWKHKLVLRAAMFTGACLTTLLPIFSSSVLAAFKDSPKAIVDEAWQIVNRE